MDLSTIQKKIIDKVYVNNSAEFVRDIELMVGNCEKYNGKRSSKQIELDFYINKVYLI